MCAGRSARYINVLICLGLVFSLISLILGVLTFGLPYIYFQSNAKRGFFQNCPGDGVSNCIRDESAYTTGTGSLNIAAFSLYIFGIFFNIISLLIIIICIAIAKKKYVSVYMSLAARIITFFVLVLSSATYLAGMILAAIYLIYSNNSKNLGMNAMFYVGWIAMGFAVLATLAILLSLCRVRVTHESSHSKTFVTENNYAYENSNADVYRMYSKN